MKETEILTVKPTTTNISITIRVLYKPPSTSNNFLRNLEQIMHRHQYNHIVIDDMNIGILKNSRILDDLKTIIVNNGYRLVSENADIRWTDMCICNISWQNKYGILNKLCYER